MRRGRGLGNEGGAWGMRRGRGLGNEEGEEVDIQFTVFLLRVCVGVARRLYFGAEWDLTLPISTLWCCSDFCPPPHLSLSRTGCTSCMASTSVTPVRYVGMPLIEDQKPSSDTSLYVCA